VTVTVISDLADVIGHRYAARNPGSTDLIGHLLTESYAADARRGRPALCGLRRRWKAVSLFATPEAFRDCAECTAAAGIKEAPRPPVRIAPTAPKSQAGRHTGRAAPAVGTTQAERTAARAVFLQSLTHREGRRIGGGYVDRDAALRAASYRAHRGIADGWPVPLTPCT
jgi:hypothetical protein